MCCKIFILSSGVRVLVISKYEKMSGTRKVRIQCPFEKEVSLSVKARADGQRSVRHSETDTTGEYVFNIPIMEIDISGAVDIMQIP